MFYIFITPKIWVSDRASDSFVLRKINMGWLILKLFTVLFSVEEVKKPLDIFVVWISIYNSAYNLRHEDTIISFFALMQYFHQKVGGALIWAGSDVSALSSIKKTVTHWILNESNSLYCSFHILQRVLYQKNNTNHSQFIFIGLFFCLFSDDSYLAKIFYL